MLHIGIVASSAEGAALCYRTICVEGADLLGPYNHPEVSMHGHPFIQYKNCIYANDWAGVAELMLSSSENWPRPAPIFSSPPSTRCIRLSIWSSTAPRAPGCTLR